MDPDYLLVQRIEQYESLETPFYYDYTLGWTQLFEYAGVGQNQIGGGSGDAALLFEQDDHMEKTE